MIEALKVVLIAFSVVFVGMGMLTALLYGMNWLKGVVARRSRAETRTVEAIAPETLAVLAAAAYAVLGQRVRIHRVHLHRERGDEAWTRVGRMDLLLTHRVVPKR